MHIPSGKYQTKFAGPTYILLALTTRLSSYIGIGMTAPGGYKGKSTKLYWIKPVEIKPNRILVSISSL